jgi:NAD dependent epimerase/dehydratase family enzyme
MTTSRSIAVSGSHGLVGRRLCHCLSHDRHRIVRLVRRREAAGENAVYWSPDAYEFDAERLESINAVVHLAGENIAEGRWTGDKKRAIRDGRVKGTQLLCEGIARRAHKPETLICASAVGYYGNRGDEMLLSSVRAVPRRLEQRAFEFSYPHLEGALRAELMCPS